MAWTLATLKSAMDEYTQNTYWGASGKEQQDNFVRLVEERINNLVQIDSYNTKSVTGTLSSSDRIVEIADSDTAPISVLYFKIRAGGSVVANPWEFLLLKDYDFLQEYATKDSVEGSPRYYSFYNNASDADKATFPFAPISDDGYDYEILYYFNPVSLVSTATTWLGNHAENALLYGCLVEAYTYLKGEPELLQNYELRFREGIESMVASEGGVFRNKKRFSIPPMAIPQ